MEVFSFNRNIYKNDIIFIYLQYQTKFKLEQNSSLIFLKQTEFKQLWSKLDKFELELEFDFTQIELSLSLYYLSLAQI